MLESECVINSLKDKLEIGRTTDEWMIYCKTDKMSLEDLEEHLRVRLSRFGLKPYVIHKKKDPSGNVLLIDIYNL